MPDEEIDGAARGGHARGRTRSSWGGGRTSSSSRSGRMCSTRPSRPIRTARASFARAARDGTWPQRHDQAGVLEDAEGRDLEELAHPARLRSARHRGDEATTGQGHDHLRQRIDRVAADAARPHRRVPVHRQPGPARQRPAAAGRRSEPRRGAGAAGGQAFPSGNVMLRYARAG